MLNWLYKKLGEKSYIRVLILLQLIPALVLTAIIAEAALAPFKIRGKGIILPKAETVFSIYQSGECVGFLKSTFTDDSELKILEIKGEITTSTGDIPYSALINSELNFNILDQLGASITTFELPGYKFILGTLQTDPIEVSLSIDKDGNRIFSRSISLPGPVELRSEGTEIQIHYPALPLLQNSQEITQTQSLLNLEVKEEDQTCSNPEARSKPIDLSALTSLASKLNSLIPQSYSYEIF